MVVLMLLRPTNGTLGVAFIVFHGQILRDFLFLPVLAVLLLNILSRVYCNNYKLNFIIIKNNNKDF